MKKRRFASIVLVLLLMAALLTGCAQPAPQVDADDATEDTVAEEVAEEQEDAAEDAAEALEDATEVDDAEDVLEDADDTPDADDVAEVEDIGETRVFIDSVGREVELPEELTRIAPTGPSAQTTLLTLVPDRLVALAGTFESDQEVYFPEEIVNLPELGNLYGDTLNLETLLTTDPQVIIDIGDMKDTVEEDMNRIQEQTGIPTVFVHMEIDNMGDGYRMLGELLDMEDEAEVLAEYIERTLADAQEKADSIAEDERKTVYYAGDDGLTAYIAGTVHTDVIDYAGGINVADVEEATERGGGAIVSLEQVMNWDPDVILFVPDTAYDEVADQPEWAEVHAIQDGSYYEVPMGPYNWMGRPPSLSRVMGIKWLGNLLYPDVFDYDMIEETQEFYELFYHYQLAPEDVEELLAHSSYK